MKPENLFAKISRLLKKGDAVKVKLELKDGRTIENTAVDVVCGTLRTDAHLPFRPDHIKTGSVLKPSVF